MKPSPSPGHSPGPAAAGIRVRRRDDIPVIVADAGWRRIVPDTARLVRRAARAADLTGSVVLASDTLVQRLNLRHRGRNKPTNVLTFEPGAGTQAEIILARGVVRREARAAGRCPAHHLAHLVVHGALHLQGLDHGSVGAARRMEMAETRILHRLGVPNPWKPASGRAA